MRPIRLHLPSVAIGVAAVALVLVSMGQAVPPVGPPRIEYGPNPHDYIQIKEGTPYTVPAGRLFVLTGLGVYQAGPVNVNLSVDGVTEVSVSNTSNGASVCSIADVPPGMTVRAGSTIAIGGSGGLGRALGYLAPQ